MDISQLVEELQRPSAIPHPVEKVEFRQTHISAVFLAGDFVYKLKKPVKLGFLDFSTMEQRKHFCEVEVELNRRLAPSVYLAVVPVGRTPEGARFEASGEVIDWAVKMKRLPDEATFEERLHDRRLQTAELEKLGQKLAAFHASARTDARITKFGHYETVRQSLMQVFQNSANHVGLTVHPDAFQKVKTLTEKELESQRPLIDERARQGKTRDCHGDLHLDHIYWFGGESEEDEIVIIDCIEFNEPFRFIDPVADMAFAVMDFHFFGRRDLARIFADAYFAASGDHKGRALLPLYTAYRSSVRGMVDGVLLMEKEVSQEEREKALKRGMAHWLLALVELSPPKDRPALVLVGGLPGSGKSTLARELARAAGFRLIRSDVVRKEHFAQAPAAAPPTEQQATLYSPAQSERVYAHCRDLAVKQLFEGGRVMVDATFRSDRQRQEFLELAVSAGVPSLLILCEASPGTIQKRLEGRHGDASDADWTVYRNMAQNWDRLTARPGQTVHTISTEEAPASLVQTALEFLTQSGIWSDPENP
jgi:aminoglycoside phosphotransferase family enzyme/predicted kinase